VAGEKIRDAQSIDAGEGVFCVGSLLMHERNLTPLDGHDRTAPTKCCGGGSPAVDSSRKAPALNARFAGVNQSTQTPAIGPPFAIDARIGRPLIEDTREVS
jgi:hypothetical protein